MKTFVLWMVLITTGPTWAMEQAPIPPEPDDKTCAAKLAAETILESKRDEIIALRRRLQELASVYIPVPPPPVPRTAQIPPAPIPTSLPTPSAIPEGSSADVAPTNSPPAVDATPPDRAEQLAREIAAEQARIQVLIADLRRATSYYDVLALADHAQKATDFTVAKNQSGGWDFRPPNRVSAWARDLRARWASALRARAVRRAQSQAARPTAYASPYSYPGSTRASSANEGPSRILAWAAAGALGLACVSGVTCTQYSDHAYIESADKERDHTNDPRHVENLIQILEGRGTFGTPSPEDQNNAFRVLTNPYGLGGKNTSVTPLQLERILGSALDEKLKMAPQNYPTDGDDFGHLVRNVIERNPADADSLLRRCASCLHRQKADIRLRAPLVDIAIRYQGEGELNKLPNRLRTAVIATIIEQITQENGGHYRDPHYRTGLVRAEWFGKLKDDHLVFEMTHNEALRNAVFASWEKSEAIYWAVWPSSLHDLFLQYGQKIPYRPDGRGW